MKSKDNYISTAKAIGIILMVVGHSIGPNILCRFIYMFHMPLFLFCSGYFYKVPDTMCGCGQFFIKRIKGLYFPFVKWSFLFLMLHNLFYYLHFYPSDIDYYGYYGFYDYIIHLKSILTTMTGQEKILDPFWFLKELFFASILVCLLTFLLKGLLFKCKNLLLLLVLVTLTVVTKPEELGLPIVWNLSILFLSATFFFCGFIYREVENVKLYTVISLLFCLIVVFSFVFIWNDSLDMLWYDAYSVLLYIPIALVGIYMVFSASYLIEQFRIKRIFYYIGRNTLIILSLHLLVFKIVSLFLISIYDLPIERLADSYVYVENYYWKLVYVICGVGVPLLCYEFYYYFIKMLYNKLGCHANKM